MLQAVKKLTRRKTCYRLCIQSMDMHDRIKVLYFTTIGEQRYRARNRDKVKVQVHGPDHAKESTLVVTFDDSFQMQSLSHGRLLFLLSFVSTAQTLGNVHVDRPS